MAEGHWCTSRSPDVSLRGAKRRGNLAVPGRIVGKPSAKSQLPSRDCHVGLWPPRNDKLGSLTHSPEISPDLQLPKAVTTRKGYAASVRRQSRQRLRSDRRYRRNWCIPFSRRPVRIGSIAPSEACPSPTTRKQLPCTTPDFRQNVFDISGAGGYNKDVETQTVATNITYLFPICELDHSQISESSGCDRRLTFFLSEANRRSGRRGNRLRREEKSERKPSGCPFAFNNPPQRKIAK